MTSALDPELVGEVLDMMRALALDRDDLVLATHEMAFARDVATTVCFLHDGGILEQGPPRRSSSGRRRSAPASSCGGSCHRYPWGV